MKVPVLDDPERNLATNLLIGRLDPTRVNATAHAFGADSIVVLRGVEDGKAYQTRGYPDRADGPADG